jgi:hypothetical protein
MKHIEDDLDGKVTEDFKLLMRLGQSVYKKWIDRNGYLDNIGVIASLFNEANKLITDKEWLMADEKLNRLNKEISSIKSSEEWLTNIAPKEFSINDYSRKVNALENAISGHVKIAKRKENDREIGLRVDAIIKSIDYTNLSSIYLAKTQLESEKIECGNCSHSRRISDAIKKTSTRIDDWPTPINSLSEMQTRYSDLRDVKVVVRGILATSTYYNCRFSSQNKWRSFTISDSLFGGVHIYCSKGEDWCDSLHNRLAGGSSLKGAAVLKYPQHNSVCEEGQSMFLEWSSK